jgi:spermidine/putrescine transport system permease protein
MKQREIADGRRVGGAWPDALLTAAAWALPTAFILVPLLLFLTLGFFEVQGTDIAYHPTLKNYIRFFADPGLLPTFLRTCWLGLKVAAITVVLGYPVAYLLASLGGRMKYTVAMFFAVRC